MSPRSDPPDRVRKSVSRVSLAAGMVVHDERLRRKWTLRTLAERAGLSVGAVHGIESGGTASLDGYARLADALRLSLEVPVAAAAQSAARSSLAADLVHSAMGEFEARRLHGYGFELGVDEPFQHYKFAGRADLVVWSVQRRSLLHIENRTRFPNLQAVAGSYNAKRAYLPAVLADRLGIRHWRSVTHVMVCLWSGEVLHAIRLRTETFRALCPDGLEPFAGWWSGRPPADGVSSCLVVLDPLAAGRQRVSVGLDEALRTRPRHAGYAAVAARLARRDGR